jgi:hypothetical protein
MSDAADGVVGLYDDLAEGWIADRGRTLGGPEKTLDEVAALEAFVEALPPGARCGPVGPPRAARPARLKRRKEFGHRLGAIDAHVRVRTAGVPDRRTAG